MVCLLYYCFLFVCLGNYEFSPHTAYPVQDLNRKRRRAQSQGKALPRYDVEPSTPFNLNDRHEISLMKGI